DDGEDLYVFGPAGAEHPAAVFDDGLRPEGGTLVHVAAQVSDRAVPDSAWVTATRKIGRLREQAAAETGALLGRYGWRYDIAAPGGVDVDGTLGPAGPHPERAEVLYPGGIDSRYIRGAQRLEEGRPVGPYLTNPQFIEPATHHIPAGGSAR
ncbi:MAG: enterotoxin A family protein, partial [Streptomyces sp.]|nr:enterotoxin A family protein [Streptomyces sp.]